MGAVKEIWSIVLQKFDKEGKIIDTNATSFETQELAITKYRVWLGWDENNPSYALEKVSPSEHWCTRADGERLRTIVLKSYLFNKID